MQAIPLSQHISWLAYVKLLRTFFPTSGESLFVVDEYRLRVWKVVPHSSLVRAEGETAQSSVEENCVNATGSEISESSIGDLVGCIVAC